MIKTQFIFEVKNIQMDQKLSHSQELHKHLNFCEKFDLKGQGL